MSTGLNGTPMPSFTDSLSTEQRWAITDFIVSLSASSEPGYANLVVAKPSLDPIDLTKGTALFAVGSGRPIPDHRPDHGAAAGVPSARHLGDRAGHLRHGIDRAARSLARHELARRREPTGRRFPCRRRRRRAPPPPPAVAARRRRTPSAIRKPPSRPPRIPLPRPTPAAGVPSEFSDAVSIQIPSQVPTSARKPYFIFGDGQNSVDLWFFDLARPEPLQFTGRGSADVAPNDTGDVTGVASYDQGEWSVIFKRPLRASAGAPFDARSVPADRLLGLGRVLARARQQARSHAWYSLYLEPEVVTSAVGPMVRTGLLILVIELAVIGWVRWRHGSRARGELGGEPSHPAATRA